MSRGPEPATMLLDHGGERPDVHESAYVAPTATICGDVRVGPNACVMFGAIVTADGGPVDIGSHAIVMEGAVLRGTSRHPLSVGRHVLVGPRAYLTGCTVAENTFVATGSTVFNGATLGAGSEVRINGIVHLRSTLPEGSVVPIGWVAVGDPAEVLPPGAHDRIWERQEPLDFPGTVFGLERAPPEELLPKLTERYASYIKRHEADTVLTSVDADPNGSSGDP